MRFHILFEFLLKGESKFDYFLNREEMSKCLVTLLKKQYPCSESNENESEFLSYFLLLTGVNQLVDFNQTICNLTDTRDIRDSLLLTCFVRQNDYHNYFRFLGTQKNVLLSLLALNYLNFMTERALDILCFTNRGGIELKEIQSKLCFVSENEVERYIEKKAKVCFKEERAFLMMEGRQIMEESTNERYETSFHSKQEIALTIFSLIRKGIVNF